MSYTVGEPKVGLTLKWTLVREYGRSKHLVAVKNSECERTPRSVPVVEWMGLHVFYCIMFRLYYLKILMWRYLELSNLQAK